MRALMTGQRYPHALLTTLLMRIRTDHHVNHLRVSLIKAAIVRARRIDSGELTEDYLVRADANDTNPGRRLGRLFAVLERAERLALGYKINATIKDRYIGVAAAAPALVFPSLLRNSRRHAMHLRCGGARSQSMKDAKNLRQFGVGLERDIGLLLDSFESGIPRQLSTTDQGIFFIGYYQEQFGAKGGLVSAGDVETAQILMDE